MAHLIDTSNNRNNIAFTGETPWHGLGQALTPGLSVLEWQREAGLDFAVERATVEYQRNHIQHQFKARNMLYRSDTGAPLSVVGEKYKIVQPGQIMDFFAKLAIAGGFTLETAGSLSGGQRIWALAKLGEGADIIGHDTVLPYLLLATSFDGTLSTVAKFTTVRVVCQNTLSIAAPANERLKKGPVVNSVRVTHSDTFKPDAIRASLGIATSAWEKFQIDARLLAHRELKAGDIEALTYSLLEPTIQSRPDQPAPDIRKSRGYTRVLDLFGGAARGAELTEGPTAWAWLNAVTQWVDHERGRTPDTRINSAWFGAGDTLKTRALELALSA